MPDRSLSRYLQNVPRFKLVQATPRWMSNKTFRIHRKYLDSDDYFYTIKAESVYPFRISGIPRFVYIGDSHSKEDHDSNINIYASAPVTEFDSDTTLIILHHAGTCVKTTARDPFRVVWRCISIGSSFQEFETLFKAAENLINLLYPVESLTKSEIIKKEIKMPTKKTVVNPLPTPIKKVAPKAPTKPVASKPEAPKPAAPVSYCWILKGYEDDIHGPFKTHEIAKNDATKKCNKKFIGCKIEIREVDIPNLTICINEAFKGFDIDSLIDLITNKMFNSSKAIFSDNSYIYILELQEASAKKELQSLLSDWAVKYIKYNGLLVGKKLIEVFVLS